MEATKLKQDLVALAEEQSSAEKSFSTTFHSSRSPSSFMQASGSTVELGAMQKKLQQRNRQIESLREKVAQ